MNKLMTIAAIAASASSAMFADTLTWNGGGGNFSDDTKWTSDGSHAIPQNGDSVILTSTAAATIVNDIANLTLSSVTFPADSKAITVQGDFAGMTAITNLSTSVNQTFAGHVDYGANNISVYQTATKSTGNISKARVIFSGGVTGYDLDKANHTVYSGHYTLTKSEKFNFPVNNSNNTRQTIATDSTFTVKLADVTVGVHVMPGAKLFIGAATNGWNRITNTDNTTALCAWNQGEIIYGDYALSGSGGLWFGGTANTDTSKNLNTGGKIRLQKASLISTSGGIGWLNPDRYNGSGVLHNKTLVHNIYVGAGGLTFGPNNRGTGYYGSQNVYTITTLHPWRSDFTIERGRNATQDLLLGENSNDIVYFTINTTDEDDVPRTVTLNGRVKTQKTTSSLTIAGTGTNIVNSVSDDFIGIFAVSNTATALMGAGASLSNGTVSVFGTATFGVKESGTASVGTLNMDSGATLAFNFTQRDAAPTLEIAKGASVPATLNVKVSCDAGLKVSSAKAYALTSGYDFTGKTINVIDKPKWVKSVSVSPQGDVVLAAVGNGFMVIVM